MAKSWLQKKEQRKALRQTIFYLVASLVSLFLLFRFGLPALVNMAAFLGDLKSAGQSIEQEDIIPPTPPRFDYQDSAIDERLVDISGQAEAGSLVKIYVNNTFYKEVIADKNSQFHLDNIQLSPGESVFTAVSWDAAGNKSAISSPLEIIYDKEPPSLELKSPNDGEQFFDKDNQVKVIGITEESVQVSVNERRAIVNNQGEFSLNLSLSEGKNEIKVVATDKAGNQTEQIVNVEYIP